MSKVPKRHANRCLERICASGAEAPAHTSEWKSIECYAKSTKQTWFDDHVKVMLVNDSARLAWLQSQDGEELPERSVTMIDAQRRAEAERV